MWLEQKVYTFSTEKSGEVNLKDILDNVFLRVNENLTTVTLKKLFVKNSEPELESSNSGVNLIIKGWGLLENVVPLTGELNLKDSIVNISFENETLGKLEIIEIENPLFKLNDKSIEDEDVENFNKKIFELSQLKNADEETKENENPHSETFVPIVNKKYENGKIRYLNNGYVELTDKNFKLLVKESAEKTKVLLFEVVSESEINDFPEVKLLDNKSFEVTDKEKNVILKGNFTDNLLTIEEVKTV